MGDYRRDDDSNYSNEYEVRADDFTHVENNQQDNNQQYNYQQQQPETKNFYVEKMGFEINTYFEGDRRVFFN